MIVKLMIILVVACVAIISIQAIQEFLACWLCENRGKSKKLFIREHLLCWPY